LPGLEGVKPEFFVAEKEQLSADLFTPIVINLKREVINYEFFLEARSMGGSKVSKKIDITVAPFKCEFTVVKNSDYIVLKYDAAELERVTGYNVNVYDEILS
jgi:hypothetical protein